VTDVQTFSRMKTLTNCNSAIDVYMFNSERTELARFIIDNETFVSRLVVMMMAFTVGMTQVFINDYLSTFLNNLKIS
jgi:hypothetical protein